MIRRALPCLLAPAALFLALAAPAAARAQPGGAELPADGQNALRDEVGKWEPVWEKLLNGTEAADPNNTQHQQAIDSAARWATYRLTWGLEKEGKINDVLRDFNNNLQQIRIGKDKTQKLGELYVKQVIPHALEVLQAGRPVARINAARILARVPEKGPDESPADVLARLGGTDQGDLADALATVIKDPGQLDAAKLYAFRALRLLLALPQATPPALPREKEEAALGEVLKYLQARNKPFPPGATQEEIDGFRYVRREAIEALAQCPFPTLASLPDKPHPVWVLLKIAARDGVEPEPRLDERVEAALGAAHAQAGLDKDYQPDYAAHQLGLFVADFAGRYGQEKQNNPDKPPSLSWKVDASRLIEALEFMAAETKNAHVKMVSDESAKMLTKIEKALPPPNPTELQDKLQAEGSPSKELFKGAPETVVKPADRPEGAEPAPPEKKDKDR